MKDEKANKWNRPTNEDGSIHQCLATTGTTPKHESGVEQAHANSNTERVLDVVIPKMAELVHGEVQTVTSIFNTMNNDFITFARDINGKLKDIDTILKIKKSDYSKSDTTGDIPNTLQEIDKNVKGLHGNFARFAGALEALLIQKGFVSAGELYQKEEQAKL